MLDTYETGQKRKKTVFDGTVFLGAGYSVLRYPRAGGTLRAEGSYHWAEIEPPPVEPLFITESVDTVNKAAKN